MSLSDRLRRFRVSLDGIDLALFAFAALQTALVTSNLALAPALSMAERAFLGAPMVAFDAWLPPLCGLLMAALWVLPVIWRRLPRHTRAQRIRDALLIPVWAATVLLLPRVLQVWIVEGTPGWPGGSVAFVLIVTSIMLSLAVWAALRHRSRS